MPTMFEPALPSSTLRVKLVEGRSSSGAARPNSSVGRVPSKLSADRRQRWLRRGERWRACLAACGRSVDRRGRSVRAVAAVRRARGSVRVQPSAAALQARATPRTLAGHSSGLSRHRSRLKDKNAAGDTDQRKPDAETDAQPAMHADQRDFIRSSCTRPLRGSHGTRTARVSRLRSGAAAPLRRSSTARHLPCPPSERRKESIADAPQRRKRKARTPSLSGGRGQGREAQYVTDRAGARGAVSGAQPTDLPFGR